MKIKKGNKTYPLIKGDDVLVTKGTNSMKTVDDALDDQQKEIDKLKGNVKYLYYYGGVGGTGNGGGGNGSSSAKNPSLILTLANKTLVNGGSPIVLGKTGTYTLNYSVRDNVNAETFYLRIGYGNNVDNVASSRPITLSPPCKGSIDLNLQRNGEISIMWTDSNDELIDIVSQNYIVTPHTFDVKFKYISSIGEASEFSSTNEYFMGSPDVTNPFIDISYRIDLPDASGVEIQYSISNTDTSRGVTIGNNMPLSGSHRIKLEDITKNGEPLLGNDNMGKYNVNVSLIYSSNGNPVVDNFSFNFVLIPYDLYIDVRNAQNVMYNTFDEIVTAISEGVNKVPELYITQGSYGSFYVKVYEGEIRSNIETYTVACNVYDYIDDSLEYHIDNFKTIPSIPEDTKTVEEQVESDTPFYIPFTTPGIKKIVFSSNPSPNKGINRKNDTVKYIYVKEKTSEIPNWSPATNIRDYYFRANNDVNTYSNNFPVNEKFGTLPWELNVADAEPYTITNEMWNSIDPSQDTTILSIGFQYSKINSEGSEIFRIYSTATSPQPDLTLYSNKLFTDKDSELCLPYENKFNKSIQSQYHLLQIVRSFMGYDENNRPYYGTYLYIDGLPESVNASTSPGKLQIGKIVLNNVNIAYNLINIQYLDKGQNTVDSLVYHYWLKYKSHMMGLQISESEMKVFDQTNFIKFDGTNVVMEDDSVVKNLAEYMPIPTMMLSYQVPADKTVEEIEDALFKGYPNGDDSFGKRYINLYWCDPNNSWKQIEVPTMNSLIAKWYIELQGTSTMRNKIKNFSLGLETPANEFGERIFVSPNYDANDTETFLPEEIWTLKADIADSAHANNTSIGKFVNSTCSPFDTGQNHPKYIKNALQGFPVMMYFQINKKVYYLGVYNFNMGRNSYYNLGYYTADDTKSMIDNIYINKENYGPFAFSYGSARIVDDLTIAEVQDNQPQFGFHQYNQTVLFQDGNSSVTKMFGTDKKITSGSTMASAKGKISKFVEAVAKAGAYCFANIGKNAVPSMRDPQSGHIDWDDSNKALTEGLNCEDKYTVPNQVPDALWQMRYNGSDVISWDNDGFRFLDVENNPDNLFRCICKTLSDEDTINIPYLDFTSAAEYYTICMAFGMVDSVCKNMNIKSWISTETSAGLIPTFNIAFYDMDCGLGEDNSGDETVSYLAAMDYWHSEERNGSLKDVQIDWDYWNNDVGVGFDAKSSYLFAIVKYAQALLGDDKYGEHLTNYPQQFWAKLRNKDGCLRNADYFVDTFFKSGIGSIPTYLASLNYQVKYLYTGTKLDDKTNKPTSITPLVLANGFHGSRVFKVRDWLRKRLHILDMMFNVQGIKREIYSAGGVYTPLADEESLNALRDNNDVTILQSAFSTFNQNTALISGSFYVRVKAPMNTPVVIKDGSSSMMYLLNKGINNKNDEDNYNTMYFQPTNNQAYQVLGSKEFIDISMVEPLFTKYFKIESDNLENIVYGGNSIPPTNSPFYITSSSAKSVMMNIPNFKGELIINNSDLNGQAINKIDVSKSGFYGTWSNLNSLQNLNISSVTAPESSIKVYGCKKLKGDNCKISGSDAEIRTCLKELSMDDISGKFTLNNTSIENISMTALKGENAEFTINGDEVITKLTLTGFSKISINNCPNLSSLSIVEEDGNKCKSIEINLGGEYTSYIEKGTFTPKLTKLNSSRNGVYDFTGYDELETLGVSGCYGVEVIKIPNKVVKVTTFMNNLDLEFIDTTGPESCIMLTTDSTFYMCPRYGMKQSWVTTADKSVRTKMCVSPECTSLHETFDRVYQSLTTKYEKTNKYVNDWGVEVNNKPINAADAEWFFSNVVDGSKGMDDIWIDSDGVIYDSQVYGSEKIFGEDCSTNITSTNACFKYQSGINYTKPGNSIPNLSKCTSLTSMVEMYNQTGVELISSEVLSLPYELNKVRDDEGNLIPTVSFDSIIKTGEWKITKDALKNISYRLTGFNNMNFAVYGSGSESSGENSYKTKLNITSPESDNDYLDILDVMCAQKDGDDKYIPFENITSFSVFSLNSEHYVDYTKLFECCPNVTSLSGFLKTDLSRAKINELLKPCKKLTSISESCSHTGSMDNAPMIELYDFFDWENGKECTNIFSTSMDKGVGFALNKIISYENFKRILKSLIEYDKIDRLMNIFSYCTITQYDKTDDIILGEIGDGKKLSRVVNVDNLFYNCRGLDIDDKIVPLRIKRSFFEKLPNVKSLVNTFNGVNFADMLSYDFFCKRKPKDEDILIKVDGVSKDAKLKTYSYDNVIDTMYGCFENAKFVDCRCWFDVNDEVNKDLVPVNDKIMYNGFEWSGTEYYKVSYGTSTKYTIEKPVALSDALNNFTNYEKTINLSLNGGETVSILNHDIDSELSLFNNKSTDGNIYPFTTNNFGIYPTYCCLPPDIFYGCTNRCDLTDVFANTNIVGVLPNHLMSNCNSGIYFDMLLNTNIMPNVYYHYDKYTDISGYKELIKDIPVDNDTIGNDVELDESVGEVVLFRNSKGELRKRYPRKSGEYYKSQYVYVPMGYTTNMDVKNAFTFRYNLPQQVDLYASNLKNNYDISWPDEGYVTIDTLGKGYDYTYSPENRPELWPHYNQYFFLCDGSVDWKVIYNMSSPFITDGADVDFESKKSRVFSSSSTGDNKWWSGTELIERGSWYNKTRYIFNVFLNICGERNVNTGELSDKGCLIQTSIDRNNNPQLTNFISGNLCTFLNGKVFDCDGYLLSSANGSNIINFDRFGRNIILPSLNVLPDEKTDSKVILTFNKESSQFYDFMFVGGSLSNYKERYFGATYVSDFLKENNNIKYLVRQ